MTCAVGLYHSATTRTRGSHVSTLTRMGKGHTGTCYDDDVLYCMTSNHVLTATVRTSESSPFGADEKLKESRHIAAADVEVAY